MRCLWNGGLFVAVCSQQGGLGSDENGVGVKLLNDEVQCVHFGCGVELNRFFTIDSNNSNRQN